MVKLSVAVLARDNETDIVECLTSLGWADERIVLLDTRSRDRTAELARQLGARVVEHRFEDFSKQREFGLSLPQGAWLFYVDSDERASPLLGDEIHRVIQDPDRVGWWVPRRNFICGFEIRHGGWYPDYQLRLLKLGCARYDTARQVHEIVHLSGPEGFLEQPLIHHNYRTIGQFMARQRQYTAYEADILYKQGVRPKPWTYVLQPLREFWRRYIRLQGYKDGAPGLLLCALVAYYYGFRVTVQLGRLRRA
jgi:(heptosyl)LPS beta-1,4-glucosyltransferase